MTDHIFCKKCGVQLFPDAKVCPYCNTKVQRRSPVAAFFLALLKCLGYYAFFFTVQIGVSMIYEFYIIFSTTDFLNPNGFQFNEEEFYAEYSRFAPEIGIITAVITLLGYFFFFLIRRKNIFKELFPKPIFPGGIASSLTLGLTAQIIISLGLTFLYTLLPSLAEYSNSGMYEMLFQNSNPITEFINISIVTGILEELVFRGLIYNTIKKATSVKLAVFMSAVIFGAAHMNIEQFFYTALLGALMAMVYERYNNLAAPIIVHATFNGSNYLMAELNFVYLEPYVCIFILSIAVFMLVFAFLFFTKKVPASSVQKNRKA